MIINRRRSRTIFHDMNGQAIIKTDCILEFLNGIPEVDKIILDCLVVKVDEGFKRVSTDITKDLFANIIRCTTIDEEIV